MKKNKPLVLILGILLAAAVVVGLIFGVKALTKKGGEPTADSEPVSTGTPVSTGEPVPTGEPVSTGEPGTVDPTAETQPEDPAITAARTKAFYTEDGIATDDPRLDEIAAECGDYKLTQYDYLFK